MQPTEVPARFLLLEPVRVQEGKSHVLVSCRDLHLVAAALQLADGVPEEMDVGGVAHVDQYPLGLVGGPCLVLFCLVGAWLLHLVSLFGLSYDMFRLRGV
jgi:hypothetical protein